jgi:hypothetical protein
MKLNDIFKVYPFHITSGPSIIFFSFYREGGGCEWRVILLFLPSFVYFLGAQKSPRLA